MIGFHYQNNGDDILESVRNSLLQVEGTFAIALVSADHPDTLIAARRGSPLLVGVDENEYLISSDGSAIIEHTSNVIYLDDNEIVALRPEGIQAITMNADVVKKKAAKLEMTVEEIQLDGYHGHMLKEINEQPKSMANAFRGRLSKTPGMITLDGLSKVEKEWSQCKRLLITACGTAWHAGLIGEYLFEELARIPVEVEYASELRYRNPIVPSGTLAIAISQSGETADTLATLREIKIKGGAVLGVVNAVGSTIARETDAGVYLNAGPEIGVVSTKAFTSQVAVLVMMATDLGRRRHLSVERTSKIIDELNTIPQKIAEALTLESKMESLAMRLVNRNNWLYLGRGVNYPVALEGALKLKEISY